MTDTNTLAPTDAEILALNAGEVHFSESPSKYQAAGFGTQYHAGAPGVLSFARAVLAAKWGTPALASSEPAAVPASGPVGFDHKTASNFLNGKTVTDEEVRQFVAHSRWAHDDRDWLRNTIADLRREIAQRDAEIALLKTSLLDAESPTQAAHAEQVDAVALELRSAPAGVDPVARIRYERNTPGRENEMPRVLSCNRMADGVYEVFTASQVQAALAAAPSGPVRVPLTAARKGHQCQLTPPCPTTQHAVKAAQTSCVTPACAFLHRAIRTGKRTYHRRTVSGVASVQAAFRIGARIEIKALTQKRQSGPLA